VNTNYVGARTNIFVINKAFAMVKLGNLVQTSDGTAKSVSITTTPPSLAVNVTYNGSTNLPVEPGIYYVRATVTDPNYNGSAAGTLVIGKVPAILSQPLSQTRIIGETANFITSADGSEPLSYQWRKNGLNLTDATEPTLTITNVQSTDAGLYSVTVKNQFGTTTSSNAVLEIITPAQAVERLIANVKASVDRSASLVASLSHALAAINRGNTNSAINGLSAFQNQVRSQISQENEALAVSLIQSAQAIIEALH
jgi:hypothetical protein